MRKLIYLLLITTLLSCTTDNLETGFGSGNELSVTTTEITSISNNEAFTGGTINDDGDQSILSTGVCWSTTPAPTINDEVLEDFGSGATFTSQLTGLLPNTEYFVRAFIGTEQEVAYGQELSFTTTNVAPTVPCNIQDNKLDILTVNNNFSYTSVLFIEDAFGDFVLMGSGSGSDLRIYFENVAPSTGIYTTASQGFLANNECSVAGTFFNRTFRADLDHDIYVEKISDDQYNISFCDLSFGCVDTSFALPNFTANANLKN